MIMAKIYGLFGAMTGKVSDVVMSVRNGEQIVRKYQPIVGNPNSEAQVEARAKLKLMSQLSAVVAPVICIPRQGAVSSRNLFVKKNYQLTSFQNNQAEVQLPMVQLTNSAVAFPAVVAARGENAIAAYVSNPRIGQTPESGALGVDRVVFCLVSKAADGKLRLAESKLVNSATPLGVWETEFAPTSNECVIYAYGIRFNTEAVRVVFGSLTATTGEAFAKILTTRTTLFDDVTVTETTALQLPAVV